MTKIKTLWIEYLLNLGFVIFFYVKNVGMSDKITNIFYFLPLVIFFITVLKTKKVLHLNILQGIFFISFFFIFSIKSGSTGADTYIIYVFIFLLLIILNAVHIKKKYVYFFNVLDVILILMILKNGLVYSINYNIIFRIVFYLSLFLKFAYIVKLFVLKKFLITFFTVLTTIFLFFSYVRYIYKYNISDISNLIFSQPQLKLDSLILPDNKYLISLDINENNIGSLKYIDTDEFYFKVKSILNIKDAGILKKNKELYFSNGIHTFDLRQNRVSNDLKEEKDLDNTMVYIEDDGDTKKIYIRSNGKRKKITYTEDEIISCGLIKEDIVYIIKKDDDKIQGSLIDVDTLEKKNIIFPFKDVKDVEIDSDMNFIASKIDRLFIGKLCPVSELKYKGLTDELLFNRIVELISEKEEFEHGIRIIRNRKTETIEVDFNSQSHLLSQIIKQHIDIMFYLYMTMSGKYRDHGIIITTCHFKEKIMTTTDMNLIKNVYYSRNSDTLNRSVMITVNDNNIRFKGGI